jgi:hypothetical protein
MIDWLLDGKPASNPFGWSRVLVVPNRACVVDTIVRIAKKRDASMRAAGAVVDSGRVGMELLGVSGVEVGIDNLDLMIEGIFQAAFHVNASVTALSVEANAGQADASK